MPCVGNNNNKDNKDTDAAAKHAAHTEALGPVMGTYTLSGEKSNGYPQYTKPNGSGGTHVLSRGKRDEEPWTVTDQESETTILKSSVPAGLPLSTTELKWQYMEGQERGRGGGGGFWKTDPEITCDPVKRVKKAMFRWCAQMFFYILPTGECTKPQ